MFRAVTSAHGSHPGARAFTGCRGECRPPGTYPNGKHWWPLAIAGIAAVSAEIIRPKAVGPRMGGCSLSNSGDSAKWARYLQEGLDCAQEPQPEHHALMSIAVTGAVLIGQWPEAAMVMVLFAVAEVIERAHWSVHVTPSVDSWT